MMDEKQTELWDAIEKNCETVEDAIRFFVGYCGLQILDDEMREFLQRLEWVEEENEYDD